jgi:hypothetical protein
MIFNKDLIKDLNQNKVVVQKNVVEGKYMDVMALSDIQIVAPAFNKFAAAKNEIHTQQFLSFPVFDIDHRLVATI